MGADSAGARVLQRRRGPGLMRRVAVAGLVAGLWCGGLIGAAQVPARAVPASGSATLPAAVRPAEATASASSATVAWIDRAALALTPQQALEALEELGPDAPAPEPWGEGGGREGWFGQAWQDVDGNGCDTRNDILGRDLEDADYSRRPGVQDRAAGAGRGVGSCPDATVYAGTLHDPYTGTTVSFTRGESTSAAVQIDHVVPLNYLYAHGAWQWDARTRALAANDPLNLIAVEGEANQSKGNCGPATCPEGSSESGHWDPAGGNGWWPEQESYRCTYAARFVSVLAAYDLGVPDADREALGSALRSCVTGGEGATSLSQRASQVDGGDVLAALRRPAIGLAVAVGVGLLGVGVLVRARQRSWTRALRRRRR